MAKHFFYHLLLFIIIGSTILALWRREAWQNWMNADANERAIISLMLLTTFLLVSLITLGFVLTE